MVDTEASRNKTLAFLSILAAAGALFLTVNLLARNITGGAIAHLETESIVYWKIILTAGMIFPLSLIVLSLRNRNPSQRINDLVGRVHRRLDQGDKEKAIRDYRRLQEVFEENEDSLPKEELLRFYSEGLKIREKFSMR